MKNFRPFFLLLYILITIFLLVLAFDDTPLAPTLLQSCVVTVIFSIFTIVVILLVNRLHIFSFPIIFLGVTFLFTCATPCLYLLYDSQAFSLWRLKYLDTLNFSLVYVNMLYSSFYIGISIFKNKIKEAHGRQPFSIVTQQEKYLFQFSLLRIVGFSLLGLSGIFVLIPTLQGKGLVTFIKSNYLQYHSERMESAVDLTFRYTFANFIPWGLILITFAAKNLKQFKLYVVLFVLPFLGITFVAGDRSSAFPIILLLFSIFYLKFYKITIIPWKKILLISLIAVYLVPVISATRLVAIKDWNASMLFDILTFKQNNFKSNVSNLNVVTSTFYATSSSLQNLPGTIRMVPGRQQYRYGIDYFVLPVVDAIPFNSAFVKYDYTTRADDIYTKPSSWSSYLYSRGTGIGFLQLAEAYLNFGPIGVVVFYILAGFLLVKFWYNSIFFRKLSIPQLALWLLFLDNVLNWVRNDATSQLRYLSWAWFIIYGGIAMIKLVFRLQNKKFVSRMEEKPV